MSNSRNENSDTGKHLISYLIKDTDSLKDYVTIHRLDDSFTVTNISDNQTSQHTSWSEASAKAEDFRKKVFDLNKKQIIYENTKSSSRRFSFRRNKI